MAGLLKAMPQSGHRLDDRRHWRCIHHQLIPGLED